MTIESNEFSIDKSIISIESENRAKSMSFQIMYASQLNYESPQPLANYSLSFENISICPEYCPKNCKGIGLHDCITNCSENCTLCTEREHCVYCLPSYFLNPDNTCQSSCPADFYKFRNNSTCLEDCPDHSFPWESFCENCNTSCKNCEYFYANSCLSCWEPEFLNPDQTCKITCPAEFFPSYESRRCEECLFPCFNCSNSPINCKSCVPNYSLMKNKTCVKECPHRFFSNSTHCLPCDQSCKTCKMRNRTCTSCAEPFYLTPTNTCEPNCPEHTYKNITKCE